MKNILIINGHPNKGSFCEALALVYLESAKQNGETDLRYVALKDLQFNPNLTYGEGNPHLELEPDLKKVQEDILWSHHIVFVYPTWWGVMPALMKGFFDRAFHSGFAFKYRENSSLWDKLLKGKTADILVTMDTPIFIYKWLMKNVGVRILKNNILKFCGVKTKKILYFGPVRPSSEEQRKDWLQKVRKQAKES